MVIQCMVRGCLCVLVCVGYDLGCVELVYGDVCCLMLCIVCVQVYVYVLWCLCDVLRMCLWRGRCCMSLFMLSGKCVCVTVLMCGVMA